MKIVPLASGSSGNSYLIRQGDHSILVDAGLTCKQLVLRIERAGEDPQRIRGIVVSHAHSDHIKGVGVLSRKFNIPVFLNKGTLSVARSALGKIAKTEIFETGKVFEIECFRIHPFSVPHDCAEPVGFRISHGASRIGIATDLGAPTSLVANLLSDLQAVVLESNHDPDMLMDGPYPWDLKQRVKGRLGHLSNYQSAQLLQRIISDQLKVVILAHMSETNNSADLALGTVRNSVPAFLDQQGKILCALQDEVGPEIEI
jgi:phosphoribosyl 1,2-cyclic phosphodiesterase